jgi:cytochrome c oxidase subunit 3
MTLLLLIVTYLFGISFIFIQFYGFNEIVDSGYNFTGPTSNITMSYVYIIAVFHILHVTAGLIVLSLVIIKHLKKVYNSKNILGFELASTFWHFVDILWVYLFLFLYFFNKIN